MYFRFPNVGLYLVTSPNTEDIYYRL